MVDRWHLVLALLAAAGCSANYYTNAADREGFSVTTEKMRVVEDFRKGLLDPREDDLPELAPAAPPSEVPAVLSLEDAVRLAVKYSREFKTQQESFYLSALDLTLTRRDYLRPVFDGSLTYRATDGRDIQLADATILALSMTQRLPTGGTVTVSGETNIETTEVLGERNQNAGATGTISISQSLWRGAGRKIAFEPLTQAERGVVYDARAFEIFRQTFTISVIRSYLNLVNAKLGLKISENQVRGQEYAYKLAQAQFRVGRGGQEDVLRAAENFLNAQNSYLDSQQAYKTQKDRFKIDLGLPVDIQFEIVEEIPDPVPFEMDPEAAVVAALHNRLDLLTERDRVYDAVRQVKISRNALAPDLDLDASFSVFSGPLNSLLELSSGNHVGTASLVLRFPLNRKAERNAYRAALIALDQSRRGLGRVEDNIALDIRSQVRDLKTQLLTIDNERKNVEVVRRRIRKANLDFQAGIASNRDIVEATDSYAAAQNRLLSRYVTYHIARLNLLQQMGLLFVDNEGQIIP